MVAEMEESCSLAAGTANIGLQAKPVPGRLAPGDAGRFTLGMSSQVVKRQAEPINEVLIHRQVSEASSKQMAGSAALVDLARLLGQQTARKHRRNLGIGKMDLGFVLLAVVFVVTVIWFCLNRTVGG